jgi:hypothetical protein
MVAESAGVLSADVHELIRRQGGVLSHEQALALGVRRRQLGQPGSGRLLVRVRHAAYALSTSYDGTSPAARMALSVAAERLVAEAPLVAFGGTAAVIHGLPVLGRTDRLELRPPAEREPLVSVRGVELTGLGRTAMDIARRRGFAAGTVTADAVLRRGVPRDELLAVLEFAGRWPGVRIARAVAAFADGGSESALESLARVRFHEDGLPAPELQVTIADADGPFAVVDHYWDEYRTIGEADGALKYTTPEALFAEKRREDRLREAGFEVVRYTWAEVLHHPDVVSARIRRAFARARRAA